MLQTALEQRGLKFKMAARTQRLISDGSDHIKAVRFEDGSELDCDLFIMAIGVRPNIALARESGLIVKEVSS